MNNIKRIIRNVLDEAGPTKSFNKLASEYQKEALKHQKLVDTQKKLANQFVSEKDPKKKEKLKPGLINHSKKVKEQEKAMQSAEARMMHALDQEPLDDIDESVNEGISVFDERHFGKKGIIIMIDDNGKKVSAIFKDKKNADKFNRNNPSDIQALLKIAKTKPFGKAIDESVNEEKPGLWANIRAKQKRGEKPAHKNSQAHKDAVKAGKKINKEESVNEERVMFDDEDMISKGTLGYYQELGNRGVGAFHPKTWRTDGHLMTLDSFDKKLVKDIKLKSDERIFRYTSKATNIGGIRPLIKINIKKGLVYFLTQDSSDNKSETIEFEKKGVPTHYMRIRKSKMNESKNMVNEIDFATIGQAILGITVGSSLGVLVLLYLLPGISFKFPWSKLKANVDVTGFIRDKRIKAIINRLYKDDDIKKLVKNPNKSGFRKMIDSKLTDEEKKIISQREKKYINRNDFRRIVKSEQNNYIGR